METPWISRLNDLPGDNLFLWVYDFETRTMVDMTAAVSRLFDPDTQRLMEIPRTLSFEDHNKIALEVIRTGKPNTTVEWMRIGGAWLKLARTKTHAGGSLVMEQAVDITRHDLRAQWLARIDLNTERLNMDNGESFSFAEFVVLHFLVRGLRYKNIAERLNISIKTVEYRIGRLKIALQAESTEELMWKVASSGLIQIAIIEFDYTHSPRTELELYQNLGDNESTG